MSITTATAAAAMAAAVSLNSLVYRYEDTVMIPSRAPRHHAATIQPRLSGLAIHTTREEEGRRGARGEHDWIRRQAKRYRYAHPL